VTDMDIPTVRPPALKNGDTIAVIAPAGPIEQREALERGIAALQKMGFHVKFDERIFNVTRYLAGDDFSRAEELMRAFEDSSIQAIIALRGGYGCSRLIPLLKEKRLRNHPKIFMGFSDLTTLHLFFRRRFGWITFHGPMAVSPALANIAADQEKHLLSLWTDPEYRPTLHFPQLETWMPGTAEGVLVGGCLSIIATSIGTPYEIKTEGKILLLEDHGEDPYRIDRMLTHLKQANKLQSLAGLLLGEFRNCDPPERSYTARDTLQEILVKLDVPIIANFPAGHGEDNWAIPLGAKVKINADARTISFVDPAVQ
jgi:muramoyltetrapeptide carboxypeptidase